MRVLHVAGLLALVAGATSSLLEAAPPSARAGRVAAGTAGSAQAQTQTQWSAQLTGRDGRKVSGRATATATADGKGTAVTVTLEGDTPGATRPWHIHAGSCAQSGAVVGGGRAYTPIAIDAKGQGSGKATLAVPLADSATYYVNIHDAAAAMGIIVACGDLRRP